MYLRLVLAVAHSLRCLPFADMANRCWLTAEGVYLRLILAQVLSSTLLAHRLRCVPYAGVGVGSQLKVSTLGWCGQWLTGVGHYLRLGWLTGVGHHLTMVWELAHSIRCTP